MIDETEINSMIVTREFDTIIFLNQENYTKFYSQLRSIIVEFLRSKSFYKEYDESNKFIMVFTNNIISFRTIKEGFTFFEMIKYSLIGELIPSFKKRVLDSAYARTIESIQPQTPFEVTIKFYITLENPPRLRVNIQVTPFLYHQIFRVSYRKKDLLKENDLAVINRSSIGLCGDIGASFHGFPVQIAPLPQKENQISIELPTDILSSLKNFKMDYPDPKKVGFIMMKFGKSEVYGHIATVIKEVLSNNGLVGVRADDKEYHREKFPNILTYIHGCGFGIAIFETIESSDCNPNVSLEAGSLIALSKPVCLLKDRRSIVTPDIEGWIYKEFNSDMDYCKDTISSVVTKWLYDNNILKKTE